MTTKFIRAQDQGLRHHFGALLAAVRTFSAGLYAACGGFVPASRRDIASSN